MIKNLCRFYGVNSILTYLHGLPKSQSEFKFVPLESGIYEFYCTIPGHKEAGMKGIMNVN
jgi:plastocyanin